MASPDHLPATSSLVMAMPRRELFTVQGLQTRLELRILESVAEESWFAEPSSLREDIDAKEVRLALVLRRKGESGTSDWLLSEQGELLHATPVPAQVTGLGEGLKSLRELARLAARELLGGKPRDLQLWAYLNDDALPELKPFFILIYQVVAEPGNPAPAGMSWVGAGQLRRLPLDAASIVVAEGLPAA